MFFLLTEVLLVTLIPASIIQGSHPNQQQDEGRAQSSHELELDIDSMYPLQLKTLAVTTKPSSLSLEPKMARFWRPDPTEFPESGGESEAKTTTLTLKHSNNNHKNALVNEPTLSSKTTNHNNFLIMPQQKPVQQNSQAPSGRILTSSLSSISRGIASTGAGTINSVRSMIFNPSSGSRQSAGGNNNNNNNNIVFENEKTIEEKRPVCNQLNETFYQSKCYPLLKQEPCRVGEWLVEIHDVPQCVRRPCPSPKLSFNGECYWPNELMQAHYQFCQEGMVPYTNRDGTVQCGCRPDFIRDSRDGKCYEIYRKGPCGNSEYFALVKDAVKGHVAKCTPNPCGMESFAPYGNSVSVDIKEGDCVRLNSPCNGGSNLIQVDSATLQLKCMPSNTNGRTIGNVPSFACSKGYKRDVNGVCRRTTTFTFS